MHAGISEGLFKQNPREPEDEYTRLGFRSELD